MLRRYIKPVLAIAVLVLTLAAFIHYIATHPDALNQLRNVNAAIIIGLLLLYAVTLACLALAQEGTLNLCKTRLERSEAFLLVSYTALVNFFGPLQSGPGFRAVYLKKKYGTKLKNYALATLIYFGFFAGFSGMFLLSGLVGWRWLALIALTLVCVSLLALRTKLPYMRKFRDLHLSGTLKLGIATFLQVAVICLIYFIELRSVNSQIHFSQAVIYTGAANFALFVSITPGAIGFRESFLLFSSRLHHIDKATVINASLLDRGVYVLFLGIIFIFVVASHTKTRLQAAANKPDR